MGEEKKIGFADAYACAHEAEIRKAGGASGGAWIRAAALLAVTLGAAAAGWFGLPCLAAPRAVGVPARAATALLLVLLSEGVLRACLRGFFFCPDCRTWNRSHVTLRRLHLMIPESRAFVQLAAGDVSPLLSASPVPAPHATSLRVVVRSCASCCRGEMRVARMEGRKAVSVPRLGRVELAPDAVRSLLELARREKEMDSFA